ncbi:hypothetical protein AOQ84DRAFT_278336, partial [Glonium stellatum]
TITALYDIDCFFGAIATIVIGDSLGCNKSILLDTTIMSVGAILRISAFSAANDCWLVGPPAIPINLLITLTTLASLLEPETRGKLIFIEMIMNIAGFSL